MDSSVRLPDRPPALDAGTGERDVENIFIEIGEDRAEVRKARLAL